MKSGKYTIKIMGEFTVMADSEAEALDIVLSEVAETGMDLAPDGITVEDSQPNRPSNGKFNHEPED